MLEFRKYLRRADLRQLRPSSLFILDIILPDFPMMEHLLGSGENGSKGCMISIGSS